ncbi:helix-turn-helix domain-containing protein [Nostoc sp. DedSLP04]|uniref:helix-turn-helix domain-containing protein n=1 Tax=Nostoc sp. DedSLP04 TaxID=3075401 RepID=UPI002AD2771A|nr:helix-turn-helix domain-containing protein [Nostoc sp. DedSLP04]MDZ8032648.1 helix-turn-helix domain-containing protein [Nostoc sp. DedSLP04]
MSRPFRIEISESQEELETALKHATTASNKERLQMLYWVKSGQVSSRQSLAERLGRDEATITRWVRKYKDERKKGLLFVKHAPGEVPIISGSDLERLKQLMSSKKLHLP